MKNAIAVLTSVIALAVVAAPQKGPDPAKVSVETWRALKKETDGIIGKNFKGGFADYRHEHIDKARAILEKALTRGEFMPSEKIDICREIARCYLESTRDVAAALAWVEYPLKKLQLNDKEREKANNVLNAFKQTVGIEVPAAAASEPKVDRWSDPKYYASEIAKAKKGYSGYMLERYVSFLARNNPKDMFRKLNELVDKDLAMNPNSAAVRHIFIGLAGLYGWNPPAITRNPALRGQILKFVADNKSKGVQPNDWDMFKFTAGNGSTHDLAYAAAKRLLALDEETFTKKLRLSAKDRGWMMRFCALQDVIKNPANATAVATKYAADIKKPGDKVEIAKLLADGARHFVCKYDGKTAQVIIAQHEKIVPVRKQVQTECFWWQNAPRNIKSILDSNEFRSRKKWPLALKYGDNLKFLIETDSALVGRELTKDDGTKFRPTEFFAFADDVGVKMLLRLYLDNMDDVKAGFAGVPGFESYVCTGIDNAYHCLMFSPTEGGGNEDISFLTQYDNITGHRSIQKTSIYIDTIFLDDGVATLITFPWQFVWASIPSAKTPAWYVEFLGWMKGGYSLGGSTTVHSRSSFAEMKFTGFDEKAMTAIKRRILLSAKHVFGRSLNSRSNGYLENFQDPGLGDQEFYDAKVRPLVDEIRPYSARIKKGMTDADVNEIYDAVGEKMMNIEFIVEDLRRKWLDEKFTNE